MKGCNGIIVGFGQTGTGKSFTLSGLELAEQVNNISFFNHFKVLITSLLCEILVQNNSLISYSCC